MKLIISALALSASASRILENSADFRAKMWMKSHMMFNQKTHQYDRNDPSGDEAGMQDLKNSDPNAFAIVQALLTKQSLGLLDPNHPSVKFGGAAAPKKHKSFQEEAEEAGLTQDTPSSAVTSQMEMGSSMPYPSVGASSAAPYPEVRASHNPWNYKTTHSDDELVNSVLGDEAAAPAQPQSDPLSLSAMTAQYTAPVQAAPAQPVEQYAAPVQAAPVPLQAQAAGIPNLNWGNPMTGSSEEAPAAPASQASPAAEPEQADSTDMLSLSAVRSQEESRMGITESATRFAAPVAPSQPAPVANVQPAPVEEVRTWNQPAQDSMAAMNIVNKESLAAVAAPVVQPEAVMQPAPVTLSSYAQPKLGMSEFTARMGRYGSSYRMNLHASDATPTSDNILSLRNQNMGNSYDSYLKQARTNRWKRAMDVTMNMKPIGGNGHNDYLKDLS